MAFSDLQIKEESLIMMSGKLSHVFHYPSKYAVIATLTHAKIKSQDQSYNMLTDRNNNVCQ